MEEESSTKDEKIIQGSFFNISRPSTPYFFAEAFNALLRCLGLGGHHQCPSRTSQESSSSKQEKDGDGKACTEETLQDPPSATTAAADPQADPPAVDSVEDARPDITSLAKRAGRGPPISRGGGGKINSVTTQSS